MTLRILGPIPAAWLAILGRRQNRRPGQDRAAVMGVHVIDVHQHAVDDPRHRRPGTRALAVLAMTSRPFVVGRRCGEHDDAVPGLHLAVTQSAAIEHACPLLESEGVMKPLRGGHPWPGPPRMTGAPSSRLFTTMRVHLQPTDGLCSASRASGLARRTARRREEARSSMYVRSSRVQFPPDQLDRAIAHFKDVTVP